MIRIIQPRAASIARCAAALMIAGLSLSSPAQSTPAPSPQTASSPSSPAKAPATPPRAHPGRHQLEQAEDAYLAGARLLERKDVTGAQAQFAKAVELNPDNPDYARAAAASREYHVDQLVQQAGKARILGQNIKAESLLNEARKIDPQNSIVTQYNDPGALPTAFHPEPEPWIRNIPSIDGPITLQPNSGLKSFHLHADVQSVIRQIMTAYGITPTFDSSIVAQSLRFDLDDTSYQQAVPILLSMANLFAVPLDAKSVFLAKDTPENRQKFERLLQETVFVPGMTIEQMGELGNVIRNVFDIKQLTVQNNAGTLVIRAPEDTLRAVNLTLADLIDGGSQVMLELRLYEVDKTNQRNIGSQLPQQVGIYSVAGTAQGIVSANQSLVNQAIAQGLVPANASNTVIALALIASGLVQNTLLSSTVGMFGGGITQFGVTNNQNPAFNLALSSSNTTALDDIHLRTGDRQTATFRAGSRYPITTSTYSSGLTGAGAGALAGVNINGVSASSLLGQAGSSITIPEIQYEDIGITLKTTPTVQKSGAVSVHVDLKIEALAGSSADNIPVLNNRQFVSDVTIDDGETALLASAISKSESAAINGVPGLGELPGFQSIAADKIAETDSNELILLITPHIVRRRSDTTASPRIVVDVRDKAN
jgi:general secretion pathway protein D